MTLRDVKNFRPSIIVIDNYDSFTWNLVHYLEELGAKTTVFRNDAHTAEQIIDMSPAGIVLSPGPCTPNEAGICLDLVKSTPESLPVFGVCLGHQAIAQATGATIVSAQSILHGKTSTVTHTGHSLFKNIPAMFKAVRYHSLAIKPDTVPESLDVIATTDDGEIMAIAHKERPLYGVQFHPESIGSEYGHALLGNFLIETLGS